MDGVRKGGRVEVEEREEIDRWRERAEGRSGGCEERTEREPLGGRSLGIRRRREGGRHGERLGMR